MKIKALALVLPAAMLFACGGAEEETTEETSDSDSTAVVEEEVEESTLAFDGVEKGDYMLYGHTEIEAGEAYSIEEMMIEYSTTDVFNDKVNVNIDEVCQKAGCWITFKDLEDNSIRVYFRDHFTIPTETVSGTEAILYGSLYTDTISVDFQKHLMEDALEEGEELDEEAVAALEEKLELAFDCESILVKQ